MSLGDGVNTCAHHTENPWSNWLKPCGQGRIQEGRDPDCQRSQQGLCECQPIRMVQSNYLVLARFLILCFVAKLKSIGLVASTFFRGLRNKFEESGEGKGTLSRDFGRFVHDR